MKPKKNPKVDLRKKTGLFLQFGLIAVLLFSYSLINLKTPDHKQAINNKWDYSKDIIEEPIPITKIRKELPPPKPKISPIIEVIDNESEKTEDEIETTETSLEDIREVEDIIETPEFEEVAPVSFEIIEDVPIFPGCESLTDNEDRKACMSQHISKFIGKHFDTSLAEDLGLHGVNRVTVLFEINKQGEVSNIQARGPHKKLEDEAKRVLNLLPKMKPGKQRGKAVPVSYAIPINFQVRN